MGKVEWKNIKPEIPPHPDKQLSVETTESGVSQTEDGITDTPLNWSIKRNHQRRSLKNGEVKRT